MITLTKKPKNHVNNNIAPKTQANRNMYLQLKYQKNCIHNSNSIYSTKLDLLTPSVFFIWNIFSSLAAAISCSTYFSRSAAPELQVAPVPCTPKLTVHPAVILLPPDIPAPEFPPKSSIWYSFPLALFFNKIFPLLTTTCSLWLVRLAMQLPTL